MTVKIHKIDKITLDMIDSVNVGLIDTTGMTISHYACSVKSAEGTLGFSIEGVDEFVPEINDVEFSVVVRKKIDMTATGVNEKVKKNIGEDIGEYKHTDAVPSRPSDLPPGFTEIYKSK